MSYRPGARCALAAAHPRAVPRHFSEDRGFDCRMQNQLERLMEMQEGNSKKNIHTSSKPKKKRKKTLKTPKLIFILEGAASKPQTL